MNATQNILNCNFSRILNVGVWISFLEVSKNYEELFMFSHLNFKFNNDRNLIPDFLIKQHFSGIKVSKIHNSNVRYFFKIGFYGIDLLEWTGTPDKRDIKPNKA